MKVFQDHQGDLTRLAEANRLRRLIPCEGRDFSSNDYLGLAGSGRLKDAMAAAAERGIPVGAGGSRLLRGNHAEHEALEEDAATFFGAASALFFSSGYAANAALLSTLPQRGDLVLHDVLVHASAHEGMRLGRAETAAVRHNDPQAFEDDIRSWRRSGGTGRVWIAVESLYSMDGDFAPLGDLAALADRHDAILLIDEAHATGLFGPDGRGLAADLEGRENVITLRTCGKALGCEGALLCGSRIMRDFLVNRGRPFIFSTAPSPLIAAVVRAALRVLVDEPERRTRLRHLIELAGAEFRRAGASVTGSQILPIILGGDEKTMRAAQSLQDRGFDVRGIRPPTVPDGTARLRVSITLNIGRADILALADTLDQVLAPEAVG